MIDARARRRAACRTTEDSLDEIASTRLTEDDAVLHCRRQRIRRPERQRTALLSEGGKWKPSGTRSERHPIKVA